MNDLLGILIPLLMSGADISTIFRQLAGGSGASSYDGLQDMISRRNSLFVRGNRLSPDRDTINQHVSATLDTLGINPFTGAAQGLTSLLGSMYNLAPDAIGAFIGLPSPGSFYQQIANGAAGISVASGQGLPNLFNPYSARESYDNAVGLARKIQGFANRPRGGLNVDFTHGLNMSEVGTVAQRLLSSDIAYNRIEEDDNGRIHKERLTTEEFDKNIKDLGSKFNETVSMLTKITGSVKEAIGVMDKLGGGNFLGGTTEDALNVAKKAQSMAANIRVTAAMAGIDPKEAYANMIGMQQGLVKRYGVDPIIASASGFDALMMNPAYKATMAYQTWAAQNPGASEQDKTKMMAAAQARVTQYSGTNGEALAAMVSANKDKFTDAEIKSIETAYRVGRPNDIQRMVRERIGSAAYENYMNDPAAIMAFRMSGDKEIQDRLANAAYEGNLSLVEMEGGRRMLENDLSSSDEELTRITGQRKYRGQDRREASAAELRKMAVEKYGLSEEQASKWNVKQIRNYLMESGADMKEVTRRENTAIIDRQINEINDLRMSDAEETSARGKLSDFIDNLGVNDEKKKELKDKLADTKDLNSFYTSLARQFNLKYDSSILGGKMSNAHADSMIKNLSGSKRYWQVESTPEELERTIKSRAGQIGLKDSFALGGVIAGEDFQSKDKSDKDALAMIDKAIEEKSDKGLIYLDADSVRELALKKVVSEKLFSGGIGDIKDTASGGSENPVYRKLVSKVAKGIDERVKGGLSIDEAKKDSLKELLNDTYWKESLGKEGISEIYRLIDTSEEKNNFGRVDIASAENAVVNQESKNKLENFSKGLFDALAGDENAYKDGRLDAGKDFYTYAEKLAKAGVLDKNAFDKIDKKTLSTKEGRLKALESMVPNAKRVDGIRAAMGSSDANAALIAMTVAEAEQKGLGYDQIDFKSLGVREEDIPNLVAYLDKTSADRSQNALSNAINLGGDSIARAEIDRGKKMIGDLRDNMLKAGITSKDLVNLVSAPSSEEKQKRLDAIAGKLGKVEKDGKKVFDDPAYAAKFAYQLVEKKEIGKNDVYSLLFGGSQKNVDVNKLDDTDVANVIKKTNRQDSVAGDILEAISQLTTMVANLLRHPVSVVISQGVAQ